MAEEKKEVDSVAKTFTGIMFEKVEDAFTVNVRFNRDTELLSLKFINEKSKCVFKRDFDKKMLNKITEKCQFLKHNLVVKMIIDSLSSKELTSKNIRLYHLPDIKKGTCYYHLC